MRKFSMIISVFMTVCLLVSCGGKSVPVAQGSRTGYAISFFKNVNELSKDTDNLLVSPYSAGVALSMLSEGASGETKVELDNALNGCSFTYEKLGDGDTVIVDSANSVWIDDDFSIRNRYVNLLQKDYDALAVTLDFADPATLHAINNWCSEHTGGKIEKILSKLSPEAVMVLANALYFNAGWEKPFDEKSTEEAVFHGRTGDSKVRMMYSNDRYNYAEYQGYQMIELPYAGGVYSMFVVLPPEGTDIDGQIASLDEDILKSAMNQLAPSKVRFRMPKVRLETSRSLNPVLKNMGVRTAFSSAADFSGISAMGPLVLNEVAQKCYIDISEKGTEAAAVTVAVVGLTSFRPDSYKTMTVNRPYAFFIADKELKNIVFAGKIVTL